jgi:type II secretory pathway pseudopilin PulG
VMRRNKNYLERQYWQHNDGYTIVEALIFLAISSALAVAILGGMSGQQRRTEFSQATREAESRINDIMNDFVTGFSPTPNQSCSASAAGGAPILGGAGTTQGANFGCTYIGKVIQFSPDGNPANYKIFAIVGRQFKAGGGIDPVENIIEAVPIVLTGNTENTTFAYGLELRNLTVDRGGLPEDIGAVGFFSSFSSFTSSATGDNLDSGQQFTTVIPIPGTSLGQTEAEAIAAIENIISYSGGNYSDLKDDYVGQPVRICLTSGSGDQAVLEIGDNQGRTATKLTITSGNCT